MTMQNNQAYQKTVKTKSNKPQREQTAKPTRREAKLTGKQWKRHDKTQQFQLHA
jgi:hypothetical protein